MTAEEYIKDFTRGCSNELEDGEYEYWLTPWHAEAACNLAREEVREQFEKERLKHCDELTAEQAQMESDFVVQHLKNFNRTPTFIDAIEFGAEWGKNQAMVEIQAQSMALAHGCPEESESKDLGEYINELSKQFPEVSFAKLSRIAVRVAKWKGQQMMTKAIIREVKVDAGGYPYIDATELYDYDKDMPLAKEGDKVKILVIKE